jgi:hypothetical protein
MTSHRYVFSSNSSRYQFMLQFSKLKYDGSCSSNSGHLAIEEDEVDSLRKQYWHAVLR